MSNCINFECPRNLSPPQMRDCHYWKNPAPDDCCISMDLCEEHFKNSDQDIHTRDYFEGNTFIARWMADELKTTHQFVTMIDTGEVYYFDQGIFRSGGEKIIDRYCRGKLGKRARTYYVTETVNDVKGLSWQDRNIFFKTDPRYICLANGVLDIESWELKEYSPEYHFLTRIPVALNLNATCPKIDKFIEEVIPDPLEREAYYELVGYCLFLGYPVQVAFMFIGGGWNGKSLAIHLIRSLVGEENCTARGLQELEVNKFARAELFGKLLNSHDEVPPKTMYNSSVFKQLTGGDLITAERKFHGGFQYHNISKQVYATNRVPKVVEDTIAYFRRWRFFHFPNNFEKTDNKHLREELTTKDELEGFLLKAIMGLKKVLERGDFANAKPVEETREEWKRASDPVWSFTTDCIMVKPDEYIEKKALYEDFKTYCNIKEYPIISEDSFHKNLQYNVRLEDYRPHTDDGRRHYCWKGIKVNINGWSDGLPSSSNKLNNNIIKEIIEEKVDQIDQSQYVAKNDFGYTCRICSAGPYPIKEHILKHMEDEHPEAKNPPPS